MPPPYSPVKYAGLPATAGAEFSWRPAAAAAAAAAAASPDSRAAKLAAAAELARRCAVLGVRPPLPAREAQQPQVPAAQAVPQQPDRLDALAQRLEQQGGQLASAVTQQSQQLAAQQRLLQDVVQGLLFVGAKAGRAGPAAGSAAGTQAAAPMTAAAAPAPAGPEVLAAAGRPPRPPARQAAPPTQPTTADASPGAQLGSPERRRAALAARLRQQAGTEAGAASSSQDEEQADGRQRATSVKQLPCGLLRVPTPPPPGRGTLGGLGRRGADLVRPPPALTAALGSRQQGSAAQGVSNHRPAWDDRTVVPAPLHGRRAAADERAGSPGPVRLAGGLAPQLLLAELQRLQRRRSSGGSTIRRCLQAPLQQANRPLTAPDGMPVPHTGAGSQLLQRAKEPAEAAPARPLAPDCRKQGLEAAGAAQAAMTGMPAAGWGGRAAGGQRTVGPAQQRQAQKPAPPTRAAPSDLAPLYPALDPADQPLPELSGGQMDALCDALLRELLMEECAPGACLAPYVPR